MADVPRITYLGQSGFFIETPDLKLLIDPVNKKAGDLDGDVVYSTHNHFDHVGGVKTFLERNQDALLIGNEQVSAKFTQFGDRVKTVSDGDTFDLEPMSLTFTKLKHGVFSGVYNLAVEVQIGSFTFAHCGDAVSFEGFPTSSVDILAIPISGAFASSPKKALKMIMNLTEPLPIVVPMHWLMRNPQSFCKKLRETRPEINCIVPSIGEPLKGYE
jgi:L-ascorbate metabolism protein UlaG (beta-lactamase superfamily)